MVDNQDIRVDHSVEDLPTMKHTQSQPGDASSFAPMMTMSTFGSEYYDSQVGPSSSYIYRHGRGYGEYNEYLH